MEKNRALWWEKSWAMVKCLGVRGSNGRFSASSASRWGFHMIHRHMADVFALYPLEWTKTTKNTPRDPFRVFITLPAELLRNRMFCSTRALLRWIPMLCWWISQTACQALKKLVLDFVKVTSADLSLKGRKVCDHMSMWQLQMVHVFVSAFASCFFKDKKDKMMFKEG